MHKKHSRAYAKILKQRKYRKLRNRVMIIIVAAGITAAASVMVAFASEKEPAVKPQQTQVVPYKFQRTNAGIAAILDDFNTEYIAAAKAPETAPEPEEESQGMCLNEDDAYLLAKIAMAEAEGEDTKGKALVIKAVLNRVESEQFPDTISEVIFQKDAFTPVRNGRFDRVEPNEDCWEALNMAQEMSCDALYFERTTAEPTWHSRNLQELLVHGNHTFYKEVSK